LSAGGTATNGDINLPGGKGTIGYNFGCCNPTYGGPGGGAGGSAGSRPSSLTSPSAFIKGQGGAGYFGAGGDSAEAGNGFGNGGGASENAMNAGGGGAGVAIKWLTGLTPGNTITVTVGAAGTAGASSFGGLPGAGSGGVLIFQW